MNYNIVFFLIIFHLLRTVLKLVFNDDMKSNHIKIFLVRVAHETRRITNGNENEDAIGREALGRVGGKTVVPSMSMRVNLRGYAI